MSTWDRLKRAVRSNLERFRDDPLRARDVRALEQNVATVRGLLKELEGDLSDLRAQEERISSRIRQSLQAGDREAALDEADRLRQVREDIARVTTRLEKAQEACARAEGVQEQAQRELESEAALRERAEATVSRLEREAVSEPELDPPGKTLGTDSGPSPLVDEAAAPSGANRAKTIGGASPSEVAPEEPSSTVAKTIGPPPAAEAQAGAPKGDLLDELERLAKLKEQGLLTADEFDAAKKKLLG